MTEWQVALAIVHALTCVGIIWASMELTRRRRNEGWPVSDPLLWVYYLGAVGAGMYLVEPIEGEAPTIADVVFEGAVFLYLRLKLRNPAALAGGSKP